MSKQLQKLADRLKAFALGLPEAWEDHPWGETVAKVKKKVFVFFGRPGVDFGLSVKLPQSGEAVLREFPFTEPTGYGLGKSGWVTARFSAKQKVPAELLTEWIEESYRAIAPAKLVAQLDDPESM